MSQNELSGLLKSLEKIRSKIEDRCNDDLSLLPLLEKIEEAIEVAEMF